MAQGTRSSRRSSFSDDPLENVTHWFQENAKVIAIGVGAIAVAVSAIMVYRASETSKRERASMALYAAQAPAVEGRMDEAATELQKVVQRYGGTTSGQQAALLLAQLYFDQGKFAEGMSVLEGARGSASREFAPSIDALIGSGYELTGEHEKAAESYGRAASAADFESDKAQYQTFQGRALMAAGKLDEAKSIWEKLAANESLPFAQEARVRLGEIVGAGK